METTGAADHTQSAVAEGEALQTRETTLQRVVMSG
jgi:hypothetical protein